MSKIRPNRLKSLFYVCTGAAAAYSGLCYYQENEKFYDNVIIPAAHLFPPELTHNIAVKAHKFSLVPKSKYEDPNLLKTQVWGINFKNPIGMAAGFDKHGEAVENLHKVGFSFIEVGSVTPVAQPGNEKPRVFRLSEDKAIINRYGFNSVGHDVVFERLKKLREDNFTGVIGVNLGKNKDSPDPVSDYEEGIRRFISVADYLVINVSSPNTTGLRDLQRKTELELLLTRVVKAVKESWNELKNDNSGDTKLNRNKSQAPPLLLKLAPDLSDQQLKDIADVLKLSHCSIDGLVVSNTSTGRTSSLKGPHVEEIGGLSGQPIADQSTHVISTLYTLTKGKIPIIGVGGVFTGDDAYNKVKAGASLIQVYTSFVYHGPPRITKIKKRLEELLRNDGYNSLEEAIGKNHRGTLK